MLPVPARSATLAARAASASIVALAALTTVGCRDLSSFSTDGGAFQGPVVEANFVRAGVAAGVNLCLTLDTNHLQDTPGAISTSDGMFSSTPLRAIPQIWQDPLSTFNFGEGRTKNLLYVATSQVDGGAGTDVMVVVSLMDSGAVEVRLLQGAPTLVGDGGTSTGSNVFAIFALARQATPCMF